MRNIIFIATFLIASTWGQCSYADYVRHVAVLACNESTNKFMIRFGNVWNEDPLEKTGFAELEEGFANFWSAMNIAENRECILSNKHKVKITYKHGQAKPYGVGGGNPSAAFSLTVDDSYAYYKRMFFAGKLVRYFAINMVLYDNGTLQECIFSRNQHDPQNPLYECADVTYRLDGNHLSPKEQREMEADNLRTELQGSLSDMCLELRPSQNPPRNRIKHPVEGEYIGRLSTGVHLSEMDIDINNDGNTDKVFRIGASSGDCVGCGYNYFDGSYLVIFTDSFEHIPEFLELVNTAQIELDSSRNKSDPTIESFKGKIISLGLARSSRRYVYNVPFHYNDQIFIYSYETITNKIPSAVISKLLPDNSVEVMCKYP